MAATTLIRPGAQNLGSDKTENFLVKASDMLLAEFEAKRIMDGMVRKIEVPEGAGAVQIPVTGSIGGGYHVPGDNIIDGTNAGG